MAACGGPCEIILTYDDRRYAEGRRFAHVRDGGNLTLHNLRLSHGNGDLISQLAGDSNGGAVLVELHSWLTATNVVFFRNKCERPRQSALSSAGKGG